MTFLSQEPTTYINIKLTDRGRQLLSLGELTFDKAVLSDREIDYSFDRTGAYDLCLNRVLGPKDAHPIMNAENFDGTEAFDISSSVFSARQIVTAQTQSTGMYSGTTGSTSTITNYIVHEERWKGAGTSAPSTGITTSDDFDGGTSFSVTSPFDPKEGDYMFIRYSNPAGNPADMQSSAPFVSLFYRVSGDTSTVYVDRDVPNFSNTDTEESYFYYYPWNGVEEYYGSASTTNCKVWNLSIVRTSDEIGTTSQISGYTVYASKEYNGQKHYFGLDDSYRQIGFIHYSNNYTGNTYAEQLVAGSTQVDIPYLMWHRKDSTVGAAEEAGTRFLDQGSDIYYDNVAKTSYTLLKDGVATDSWTVGRVYQKLKLIVITDPELLTALSYKANRNWTLPPLDVSLSVNPKSPLTLGTGVSGMCRSNYVYYVTYAAEYDTPYVAGETFGYQPSMHCGYVQRISGFTDSGGNNRFLSAKFPAKAFPYLRSSAGMTAYSGTGWNANYVQLLMKEILATEDKGLDHVGGTGWKRVSALPGGNGILTGSTIDPSTLASHEFLVSRQDYDSGTTYSVNSAFTQNMDYRPKSGFSGLTYGNETLFFGNVKTIIQATVYKMVVTLQAADNAFNSSENSTFDGTQDEDTYITEIGIMNANNELVGVAKPTYPFKKNDARYLTFLLEMDF